ncbi:MAG TPA: NAD(P)-dependent oxidoreductase [Nevskiaceae bacterium]|nr:NAD(P)-dependent oxidoreductase [Nevskiaceae bacterium]
MKKIALDGDFSFTDEQLARLNALGQVEKLANASSGEEWLESVRGYDVVCTWGDHVIENLGKLENLLVTYPYTELGSFDSEELAKKNVFVANAQGGNRKSIAEWTMFMILSLYRQFPKFLRTIEQYPFTSTESLEGKKVLIVGHGTIGTEVGERCEAFGMTVDYFNRGDDVVAKVGQADVVVNALNCNPSSKNLLDAEFFPKMKQGSYYVTFSRPYTYDIDGLIAAIDAGTIAGAGIDCDPEPLFDVSNDFYKKCLSNEKILVTPHVAGVTKQAAANGLEIMVQNVEAYVSGTPRNILKK